MSTFSKVLERKDDPKYSARAVDWFKQAAGAVRVAPPRLSTLPKK